MNSADGCGWTAVNARGRGVHGVCSRGFTLVELVLVIAIVGIVAAVTVPDFVQSMRGNRLRSAARSVAMAARYARSMALLNQKDMVVRFDKERGTVAVHVAGFDASQPGPADDDDADFTPAAPAGPEPAAAGASTVEPILRVLDQVVIEEVAVNRGDIGVAPRGAGSGGGLVVRYHSNGTCDPYTVQLADERGARVSIRVDRFSSVETERLP